MIARIVLAAVSMALALFHGGAQFGLGQFAALLVNPDNGEEHRATVGLVQWFSPRPASGPLW